MKPPATLKGEARKYWMKHAKPLQEAGILTDRDTDSFAHLCRTWGLMQEMEVVPGEENYRSMGQFFNLSKQYQALAKQFGLLPRERKHSKLETEHVETDPEFDL